MTVTASSRSVRLRAAWPASKPCRRRWARRGRSLADFAFAFFWSSAAQIIGALWSIITWASGHVLHRCNRVPTLSSVEIHARGSQPASFCAPAFLPLATRPTVRFDDIAGLEDAKREVQLRMILPALHPMEAKRFGVRQGGGLLLFGPPGTGKTMLARAVAAEIDAAFFHVKPSDVMAASVGDAEANVRALFETVRRERRAVLFIDEIESLIPRRRLNGSTIMRRVVSQFLTEVDGLVGATAEDHILFLIGATNEIEMVDPAMLRPGRFDAKIHVRPPDWVARRRILEAQVAKLPLSDDVDIASLADLTDGMTGADIIAVVGRAADRAFMRTIAAKGPLAPVQMVDFLSGVTQESQSAQTNPCRGDDTAARIASAAAGAREESRLVEQLMYLADRHGVVDNDRTSGK